MKNIRKPSWTCLVLITLFCVVNTVSTLAQDDEPLKIAFVEGRSVLDTASISNIGDDGLTRLVEQFRTFGIEHISIDLSEPISDDIDLILVIRPRRSLTTTQTAHLWDYLEAGGNLLLAIDPNNHNGVRTESFNSGINKLLDQEYGIRIQDDILIDPWFDVDPLSDVTRSWSEAIPNEINSHPITQLHVLYDLPIRFWGGRSLYVESVNGVANSNTLIYTENLYGETSRFNLRDTETPQFEFNIAKDNQGRLQIGSIAENIETGSRVSIIGDSEIFQNIYGLTRNPSDEQLPLFVGNYLFVQRLMQWLLGIPEGEWLPVPDELTWIAIDGITDEWSNELPSFTDTVLEVRPLGYDIQTIRLFNNEYYSYVAIETFAELEPDAVITLRFDIGSESRLVVLQDGVISFVDENGNTIIIDDADYTISDNAEVRLPLRVIGTTPILSQVCITDKEKWVVDCFDERMSSILVGTIDPVTMRFSNIPMAFVVNSANLRVAPLVDSQRIAGLSNRTQLAVLGRNTSGDWVKVANGRYEGWIATFLLKINANIDLIPVLDE